MLNHTLKKIKRIYQDCTLGSKNQFVGVVEELKKQDEKRERCEHCQNCGKKE